MLQKRTESMKCCLNEAKTCSKKHHALKMRKARTNKKSWEDMTGAEASAIVAGGWCLGAEFDFEGNSEAFDDWAEEASADFFPMGM